MEHGQGIEVKINKHRNPDIKQNKLLSTMIFYFLFYFSRDGIAHGTRGEVMRCRVNIWEANTINVMIIIIVIVLFYYFFPHVHTALHRNEDNLCLGYWMQLLIFLCIFQNVFYYFPFFSNYRNKFHQISTEFNNSTLMWKTSCFCYCCCRVGLKFIEIQFLSAF